jgi:hypothetical protein
MLTAKVYPKSQQGKKDEATSQLSLDVSAIELLRRARKVLKFQPAAVADAVSGGTTSLKDAYDAALIEEKRVAQEKADTERLRVEAPHLLEKVHKSRPDCKMQTENVTAASHARSPIPERVGRDAFGESLAVFFLGASRIDTLDDHDRLGGARFFRRQ